VPGAAQSCRALPARAGGRHCGRSPRAFTAPWAARRRAQVQRSSAATAGCSHPARWPLACIGHASPAGRALRALCHARCLLAPLRGVRAASQSGEAAPTGRTHSGEPSDD